MAGADPIPAPVLLFDGACNLCNAAVRWIIARDRDGVFRFATLQSAAGLAPASGDPPGTVVLIDEEGLHTRSDAVLRVARRLGLPWSLAALALHLPRALRDGVYDGIARRRYRWFGRREVCMAPAPGLSGRFLADAEARAIAGSVPPRASPRA
jgi:predicted DCC family thiol-disulfide oxidoreductase YuxK